VHSVDFERLLAAPVWQRSAHFALHHVPDVPSLKLSRATRPRPEWLSTDPESPGDVPVDNAPDGCWFGVIAPKRHARRAVTRNLLKRQGRAAFARLAERLPGGLWLLRLRAPYAPRQYPSAASAALALAVRLELDALLDRAATGREARRETRHGQGHGAGTDGRRGRGTRASDRQARDTSGASPADPKAPA
jgi:ribonuclease P protein component